MTGRGVAPSDSAPPLPLCSAGMKDNSAAGLSLFSFSLSCHPLKINPLTNEERRCSNNTPLSNTPLPNCLVLLLRPLNLRSPPLAAAAGLSSSSRICRNASTALSCRAAATGVAAVAVITSGTRSRRAGGSEKATFMAGRGIWGGYLQPSAQYKLLSRPLTHSFSHTHTHAHRTSQ